MVWHCRVTLLYLCLTVYFRFHLIRISDFESFINDSDVIIYHACTLELLRNLTVLKFQPLHYYSNLWCVCDDNPFSNQVSTSISYSGSDISKVSFFLLNPDDTVLSIQLFLLVLFSNYYIRLSVMQRIIQIEEYVIQITCSKICLILHTIWKPNLGIVLLFIQNISSVREKDELQCFLRWHKLKISQQQ